jgi:hypothetical protein
MEFITLAVPIQPPALITYRVSLLLLDWDNSRIQVSLTSNTGEMKNFVYEKEIARNLMTAINKSNLAAASLHKRIIQFLITDGKLNGAVTGVPD